MRVLCTVVALPKDLNPNTVPSIKRQTVPVEKIVMVNRRGKGETRPWWAAHRIASAFNQAIEKEDLNRYDYILRVDGDVVLPPNFVEENLRQDADVVGTCSYAMLIRIPPFLRAMGGRLYPENDDAYLRAKLQSCGYRIAQLKVKPIVIRKPGTHQGPRYFTVRGREQYRLGYEPVHTLLTIREGNPRNLLLLFGYVAAWLQKEPKYDVAGYVRSYQIHRLASIITREKKKH